MRPTSWGKYPLQKKSNVGPQSIDSYPWDGRFSLGGLKDRINQSNRLDVSRWLQADSRLRLRLRHHGVIHGDELNDAKRTTFASRLGGLLDSAQDIKLPILLPLDFADYANAIVKQMPGMGDITILIPTCTPVAAPAPRSSYPEEGLFFWIIPSTLMWQQDNRRIDE